MQNWKVLVISIHLELLLETITEKKLYLRSGGGDHVACWEMLCLGFDSSRVL